MSEYMHPNYKKAARMQTVVCGFLFSVFSFVYLYVFQRDVLEALHFSLAHGKTLYAPLATALILTVIFALLRWGVNSLLGLKGEVRAWAYFPSCLILGALTDVGHTVYMDNYQTRWGWLLPLVLLVYFLVTYWLRRLFREKLNAEVPPVSLMNANLLILFVLCMMTVLIGNSNRKFHHELEAERYLRERNYEKVLKVGERSLEATRTLTALRALAMSHTASMGDRLFMYPQYYASEGLFFDNDSTRILRYTNDSVYYLLGVRPYAGESHKELLRNICYKGTGKFTALDYYLSALLLDKELDEFARAVADFYEPDEELPRYYREALIMYAAGHSGFPMQVVDTLMLERYAGYCALQKTFKLPQEEKNRMRREYGDTYWWYFDYQN
ncbi:DUF6057 family protein [Bacteroides ilei]|uniref:DUF6057 family protein n=1 Tax=Bacteroides ilei TaxID=1907658 RepID=UPI003AB29A08